MAISRGPIKGLDEYENLKIDVADRVATITINRPDARNGVNAALHRELADIWPTISRLDDVRCIILTAAGKTFSVGADREAFKNADWGDSPQLTVLPIARDMIYNFLRVRQPVITAVNGVCVGGPATITLMSDFVVMADTARIGDVHLRAAVAAGDGATSIWPLLVGLNRAKELLLFGELLEAAEAHQLGIANRVVPPTELMSTAHELADRILAGPPRAIEWTKLALNRVLRQQVEYSFDATIAYEMLSFTTKDHQAAVAAMFDGGEAEYTGE